MTKDFLAAAWPEDHFISRRGRRSALLTCVLLIALGVASCSNAQSAAVISGSDSSTAAAIPQTAPDQPSTEIGSTAAPTTTAATTTTPTDAAPSQAAPAAQSATAGLLELSDIPVRPRGTKTGYNRDQFGEAWTDDVPVDGGGNDCSTREDILRRDLSLVIMMSASDNCTVRSGTLNDQNTATAIPYLDRASSPIDIDHVVSLSDSWQSGANVFTPELRQAFANDPMNLQAVSSQANRQKGDGDAATWLPPNKDYRCEYVRRQVDVKVKYGLWVKPAEADTIRRVLTGCGGVPPLGVGSPAFVPEDPTAEQATDTPRRHRRSLPPVPTRLPRPQTGPIFCQLRRGPGRW